MRRVVGSFGRFKVSSSVEESAEAEDVEVGEEEAEEGVDDCAEEGAAG